MPHDLASDPDKTVFDYAAIVSPPKDWGRWHDLVRDLVAHLVERYGRDEVVEHWSFEVWNEANLEVFWSGTPEEYLRLYDVTADAVKAVDPRLRVGGPSSAAAGWVEELLAHVERTGSPVDFVTTHTYGSPPLDFRPTLARYGRAGRADLVDRVGRDADPLQRGERRGLRRHLPAARHGLGDARGADRGAVLLGGVRPLRGAGQAAGAAARRLRAAHRRRAAQAALVGARAARAARPDRGRERRCRATAPGRSSRRWPPPTRTARSRCWPGTSPSTRPRPPGSPELSRRVRLEVRGLDGRRGVPAAPRPGRRRPLRHRGGLGPAPRGRPGLADRGAVGRAARGGPARARSSPTARCGPTPTAWSSWSATCRCRRCRWSP